MYIYLSLSGQIYKASPNGSVIDTIIKIENLRTMPVDTTKKAFSHTGKKPFPRRIAQLPRSFVTVNEALTEIVCYPPRLIE